MRNKINNFFVGELLRDARAFDVARIKLVYNFTLFYFVMNFLGCIAFFSEGNYTFGIWGLSISIVFTTLILVFLTKQKLTAATLTYFAMHLVIGSCIFIFKKGQWSISDGGMMVVLIAFAFFTMNRTFGLVWMLYLFVFIGIGLLNEKSGGKILSYDIQEFPADPTFMILLPCLMISYMLWVYLKSKEHAELQIQQQKDQLDYQHSQITESITYARGLQEAILPVNLKEFLPNSFALYKPKDVVSGDFFWADRVGENIYVAAADCTGHGVPGAMVSMVGNNGLNKCVIELGLQKPGEILDHLSVFIEETFSKTKKNTQDGMDIALCRVELKKGMLDYAGANNQLYFIRNGELHELDADKQPIGKFINRKPFRNQSIEIKSGDCIYIFTDGYADQFGGPMGKKFKYKALKKLLIDNHHEEMDRQMEILDGTIETWRGGLDQVDDICVVGFKI
jgi:serine phosphatase RsbU (regulator of sigma subunit)